MTAFRTGPLRLPALGVVLGLGAVAQASAQGVPHLGSGRGALLIHGNFCGPGNRGPGHPPIDALDRACARHDACTPSRASGRLPKCSCHARLHAEAGRVARDPRTDPDVRRTAAFIADGAMALPCD